MPKKTHVDPVLGTLRWNEYWWEAKVPGPIAKKPIELRIETEDEATPPNEAQRKALHALVEHSDGLPQVLERALWDYYQDIVVGNYRTQMDPKEAALLTPHLEKPAEVWKLVSDLAVRVGDDRRAPEVQFVGNCVWDEEHGFEMQLVDGKYASD